MERLPTLHVAADCMQGCPAAHGGDNAIESAAWSFTVGTEDKGPIYLCPFEYFWEFPPLRRTNLILLPALQTLSILWICRIRVPVVNSSAHFIGVSITTTIE